MKRWDARRWAAAFIAAGGCLWIERRGRLGLCWRVHGFTCAQNMEARRLYRMIEDTPLRWQALALFTRWCAGPKQVLT